MAKEFRVSPHGVLRDAQMVECYRDGVFVAGIYFHQDGIRIVSKYMTEVVKEAEPALTIGGWLPSAIVKLR